MTEQQQASRAGLYGSSIGVNMLVAAIAETLGAAILIKRERPPREHEG